MAHTNLNLTQLARKIGRSPSTLHRPLNDENNLTMLSGRVLAEIAEFAGLRVMEFPGRKKGFTENEADPFKFDENSQELTNIEAAVSALCKGHSNKNAWVTRSILLDLAGLLPGDIVIVDSISSPKTGDIVCAQLFDFSANRAEIAFRIYDPPYLVTRSSAQMTKPITVDDDTVKIVGVVDSVFRNRN
ncbi:MAG: hypothetical protein AAF478_03585 [Pseudomonadota bacterium]